MIRWGILGAGNIARRFCESLKQEPDSELWAVSCRTKEKAEAFAGNYGAGHAYGGFAAMLKDPKIDAVYLALPHAYHKEWAIRALEAGKHVLCEKPAVLNEPEMQEIADVSRRTGKLFMEAMKPRFVPLYPVILDKLKEGVIGDLVRVDTSLCNLMQFENRRQTYHTEPGHGGALLDVGTYCASWLDALITGEPEITHMTANARGDYDTYIDAELNFGEMDARLECAFDRKKPRNAVLVGTQGSIVVEELHRTQRAVIYADGAEPVELVMPYEKDDFYGEIHHLVTCLKEGLSESPVMPLSASIRCAHILDVIRDGLSYTADGLKTLEEQEKVLTFEQFGSADALKLGNVLAETALDYDREVSIQITRESDGAVLFQYLMDSKSERNVVFMKGKRNVVLQSGHSSLWAYVKCQLEQAEQAAKEADIPYQNPFADSSRYCLSGGAFPIFVGETHAATVAVSGLHEGKDHELVIRGLMQVLNRTTPEFIGPAV